MAQLKDLIVTGASRFLGNIYGTLKGNADTATKATQDSAGQQINTTYIKGLSVNGKTVTYTKGNGSTGTITTKDTTYSNATTSAAGLMSAADKKSLDGLVTKVGDDPVSSQINGYAAPISHASSATTYGVSSASNYGHAKASGTTPKANGTAAVGSETSSFARGDHVHPLQSSVSGNAGTASKWQTARNINGMSVQGDANRFNYGSCSTAAATAAKVVDCAGFALATGSEITVKFTVTNTAANPTLNVNSTGAKAIYYRGAAISAGYLAANRTYTFRYNGTQYDLVGDIDTNTSTTTGTTNKTGTKLFLAGATSQTSSSTTYSNSNVYIGTDNCLYSNGSKVATVSQLNEIGGDGVLTIDTTDADAGTVPYTNADLLGGKPASEYVTATEINQLNMIYATPEMFGAAGDGVTDDTQAVQNAINSGRNVMLTGRYKISEVKLKSFVTITSSPSGRIINGKICMCPYSSIIGVTFEVTSSNTNTCIVDIGTYDATGVTNSGGDNRYTIKDVKVVTDFAVKSNLDFVYVHVGDKELAHLFGICISNVSINGRLGKVFHFKAFLKAGNIVDNGNGIWVNTVSIEDVWCGVPEYIVYIDYDDPNNLKAQMDAPLRMGELYMRAVEAEFSSYGKNDMYIGFPATITAKKFGFIDKGIFGNNTNAGSAVFYIEKQPWYNSVNTKINTDYLGESFFTYVGVSNQNIVYANGSYNVDENTIHNIFSHDVSNSAHGIKSYRTTYAPIESKELTLNLIRDNDHSKTFMGGGLAEKMVFQGCAENGGNRFSLYFRARPAIEWNDRLACLYSDLYMPNAMSKAQLGSNYTPVVGSMVFNTIVNKPMWYTGTKWVYADGTNADFE